MDLLVDLLQVGGSRVDKLGTLVLVERLVEKVEKRGVKSSTQRFDTCFHVGVHIVIDVDVIVQSDNFRGHFFRCEEKLGGGCKKSKKREMSRREEKKKSLVEEWK